jgi:hypothetical protein
MKMEDKAMISSAAIKECVICLAIIVTGVLMVFLSAFVTIYSVTLAILMGMSGIGVVLIGVIQSFFENL